jgi:hypothetical protein
MYFLIIFMVNLMNTLLYFVSFLFVSVTDIVNETVGKLAVNDLKAIGASFSQLITATMISRLVLNLRSSSSCLPPGEYAGPTPITPIKFMERTIGNLGEDLETVFDHISSSTVTDEIPLRDFGR